MTLHTPYDLPFAMHAPSTGVLGSGADLDLRIFVRGGATEAGLLSLSAVVTAWSVLANTGALCGPQLAASTSGVGDWTLPMPSANGVVFSLSRVAVDDRAAIVLTHLLRSEWEAVRFDRVELVLPADARSVHRVVHDPKHADPYPGIDRSARFAMSIEDELMHDLQVVLRFSQVLDAAQREVVASELSTWASAASGGAYAIAPMHPLEAIVVADSTLQWVDEECTWPLAKVSVHPGAFDGLANVVARLDQRGTTVHTLLVE